MRRQQAEARDVVDVLSLTEPQALVLLRAFRWQVSLLVGCCFLAAARLALLCGVVPTAAGDYGCVAGRHQRRACQGGPCAGRSRRWYFPVSPKPARRLIAVWFLLQLLAGQTLPTSASCAAWRASRSWPWTAITCAFEPASLPVCHVLSSSVCACSYCRSCWRSWLEAEHNKGTALAHARPPTADGTQLMESSVPIVHHQALRRCLRGAWPARPRVPALCPRRCTPTCSTRTSELNLGRSSSALIRGVGLVLLVAVWAGEHRVRCAGSHLCCRVSIGLGVRLLRARQFRQWLLDNYVQGHSNTLAWCPQVRERRGPIFASVVRHTI